MMIPEVVHFHSDARMDAEAVEAIKEINETGKPKNIFGMPHIRETAEYRPGNVLIYLDGQPSGVCPMRGSKLGIHYRRGICKSFGPRTYEYNYWFANSLGKRIATRMIANNSRIEIIRSTKDRFMGLPGRGRWVVRDTNSTQPREVMGRELLSGFERGLDQKYRVRMENSDIGIYMTYGGITGTIVIAFLFCQNLPQDRAKAVRNLARQLAETAKADMDMERAKKVAAGYGS